jgi:hypothetical protein
VVRAFMGLSEGLTPIDLEPLRTRALSAAAEADASAEADNTAEEAALEPAE